jgi:hypothetical protein
MGHDTNNTLDDLLNRMEDRFTRRRIKTVSILSVLSPQRMSAERKQTPQVVESLRSRWIV